MGSSSHEDDLEAQIDASERPLLLEFTAPWCGACRAMKPVLRDIAEDAGEGTSVIEVDVEQQEAIALRFGVTTLPTYLLVVDGEEKARLSGVQTRARLSRLLGMRP
ncbi:MAG: thioredoxin family protein [Sphingomonas phyllosphaerae]|uniref:thioredoxin family protein n=1 Tax=Sphingomonas phyllosphaerae TaxID=257003 RepID=UPI002FFBB92A